ncbi:MAG TPA: tautomerase family protein [Abditibacteriaceae bacterium]|jgi:phenylpyruvate tautomerase PptA (4-oxalocrotonate tautomerase family)|nr:tautomerase family protein [Abditibacteriaceae bacterium]
MAQIKIYSIRESLDAMKAQLSDVIHSCVVEALQFPADKRFHRFFPLDESDFLLPADKSSRYTIIEISMMEGRTAETKRRLIYLLFERAQGELSLSPDDLEITITETPKCNWGFRGQTGDEIALNYKVDV